MKKSLIVAVLVLMCGATASGTPTCPANSTCRPTTLAKSQANFAMAIGGGIDVRLNKMFAIRPIQLDYLLTRFKTVQVSNPTGPTANFNQNNLRYSAGLIFNFGSK